ncbi:MAG: septum formation initiator family protein [Firmicutes bacterium]|nr:septum formation initiator family protein [Bacillota bacterium]
MGRKKRRSSKFKDSSTVIDIEQARKQRQQRQEQRSQERQVREEKERSKQQRKDLRKAARPTRSGRTAEEAQEPRQWTGTSGERQGRRRMALRRRRNYRRAVVVAAVLFIVVVLGYSVGHILVLKHDLHVAKKEQITYQEEKEQLEKDLKEINDLQNLEEQARDQMRLIRPGETLYIFPENMTTQ